MVAAVVAVVLVPLAPAGIPILAAGAAAALVAWLQHGRKAEATA
ncbi:hypothetical protein [Tessaracoccus coleopterorum]